jgi:transposase-like protein
VSDANKHPYPEKKVRELTDLEKQQIRERIELGDADIQELAKRFGCSTSQVAGIKATLPK